MLTLLDIRNEVITRLQENSTPEYWTTDELNLYISNAVNEVNRETHILKKFEELIPVSAGHYKLPDDVVKILGVYYKGNKPLTHTTVEELDYSFNRNRNLMQYKDDVFYRFDDWRKAKGEAEFFIIYDNKIRVIPYEDVVTSSTSGDTLGEDYGFYMSANGVDYGFYFPVDANYGSPFEYGGIYILEIEGGTVITAYPSIYIDYVYNLPNLSNDTDTINFPDTLKNAVVYQTLFECFIREGEIQDQRKAFNFYQLYEAEIEKWKNANMPDLQPRYIERFI